MRLLHRYLRLPTLNLSILHTRSYASGNRAIRTNTLRPRRILLISTTSNRGKSIRNVTSNFRRTLKRGIRIYLNINERNYARTRAINAVPSNLRNLLRTISKCTSRRLVTRTLTRLDDNRVLLPRVSTLNITTSNGIRIVISRGERVMFFTRIIRLGHLLRRNFLIRLLFPRLGANRTTLRNTLRLLVRNLATRPNAINGNVRPRVFFDTLRA